MPQEPIRNLMGVVVENAITKIKGEKLTASGPLLITHWGMSGPAILVLSSFGARLLAEKNYRFVVQVNWVNEINHEKVLEQLISLSNEHSAKQVQTIRPYFLPTRLWYFLLEKAEIPQDRKWSEIGKKGLNKLLQLLTNDEYEVKGKTTFK